MARWFLLGLLLSTSPVLFAETADSNPLTFMLGRWHSDGFGQGAEEFWTGDSRSMAGVFRAVIGQDRVVTEFILIEHTATGAVMRWNHFNEDYSRWEAEPIEHHLIDVKPNYANFEMVAAKKGLPRNLIYSRQGDILTVWVGDLAAEDQAGAFQIEYKKVGP